MLEIEQIYHEYIKDVEANKDGRYNDPAYIGWFSASDSGQCYRKQYYSANRYDKCEKDCQSERLLRLGKILHKDFEKAVLWYADKNPDLKILTEYKFDIPEIKVMCRIDFALIDGSTIYVQDLKGIGGFPWRKRFGLEKNRDPNPSRNYELQQGTYAKGLIDNIGGIENVLLEFVWYNKDNSAMKSTKIDTNEWMSKAMNYWVGVNEVLNEIKDIDELVPKKDYGVPFQDWECNIKYCPYSHICSGVSKK